MTLSGSQAHLLDIITKAYVASGSSVTLPSGSWLITSTLALYNFSNFTIKGCSGTNGFSGTELTGKIPVTGQFLASGTPSWANAEVVDRIPNSVRANVIVIDLLGQGINSTSTILPRGAGDQPAANATEIYWNDQRLTLTKYPMNNSGINIAAGDGTYTSFLLDNTIASGTNHGFSGIMAGGYVGQNYYYSQVPCGSFSASPLYLTFTTNIAPAYSFTANQKMFLYNMPDFLNYGSYYISGSIAYVLPPNGAHPASGTISATVPINYYIIRFNNSNNIKFQDITVNGANWSAIGVDTCDQFTMEGCRIKNTGFIGIYDQSGSHHYYRNNIFERTGDIALFISEGDQPGGSSGTYFKSFIPTQTKITNNIFRYTGEVALQAVRGALDTRGVGIEISNNDFYDIPGVAIYYYGPDTYIRRNRFIRTPSRGADIGAVYAFQNYTYCNSKIIDNYFDQVYVGNPAELTGNPNLSVNCIYWDNALSYQIAKGNVMKNSSTAIQMSGRGNTYQYNAFFNQSGPTLYGQSHNIIFNVSYGSGKNANKRFLTGEQSSGSGLVEDAKVVSNTLGGKIVYLNAHLTNTGEIGGDVYFPAIGQSVHIDLYT